MRMSRFIFLIVLLAAVAVLFAGANSITGPPRFVADITDYGGQSAGVYLYTISDVATQAACADVQFIGQAHPPGIVNIDFAYNDEISGFSQFTQTGSSSIYTTIAAAIDHGGPTAGMLLANNPYTFGSSEVQAAAFALNTENIETENATIAATFTYTGTTTVGAFTPRFVGAAAPFSYASANLDTDIIASRHTSMDHFVTAIADQKAKLFVADAFQVKTTNTVVA